MPTYEVKAWITVKAKDEAQAERKAADILDQLPKHLVACTSIEGEGSIYEIEDDDDEEGIDFDPGKWRTTADGYYLIPSDELPLARLMVSFGLSKTEIGDLFDVSWQEIDQWFEHGVPSEQQDKVQALIAFCNLLERKLKTGLLAEVVRRPADVYGGKTPLELIAADQHLELLELSGASFDWDLGT